MSGSQRKIVLSGKRVGVVERASESLQRGNSGVLVGKLRRDRDLAVFDQMQQFMASLRRSAVQILVQDPIAVECPAEVGYFSHQVDHTIECLRVQFRHLGGVVGEADVEMLVRNYENR